MFVLFWCKTFQVSVGFEVTVDRVENLNFFFLLCTALYFCILLIVGQET